MTEPTNPSPEQPSQTPPVNPVPPPAGATTSSASTATTPAGFDQADIDQNKVMALLAYLGILFLVPLLAAPKSPFAKFHTNQGLNLFLVTLGASIAFFIVSIIAGFIPFVGIIISCLGGLALFGGWIAFAIMGIINAANGQAKKLPVIGDMFTLIK